MEAIRQATKDGIEKNLDNYEQMKKVAYAYTNKRECSIQVFVYHVFSGQWLRKTFPGAVFTNSNPPEKKYSLFLSKKQVLEMPEESTNCFVRMKNHKENFEKKPSLRLINPAKNKIRHI